jgi:hypothetical protein
MTPCEFECLDFTPIGWFVTKATEVPKEPEVSEVPGGNNSDIANKKKFEERRGGGMPNVERQNRYRNLAISVLKKNQRTGSNIYVRDWDPAIRTMRTDWLFVLGSSMEQM